MIAQRYQIVRAIGQGAFGTTYEAEDVTKGNQVAIKVLSLRETQDWKALDLFERESQVLAHLNHPAIPKYLDYLYEDTQDDRHFYLVQELVEGDSLDRLVARGWHATEQDVRDIAEQVLKILDYLHWLSPPVIHRDIKPQNIIRNRDGLIYLVDFGSVQDIYRRTLIEGGTFVGTVGYMPPEQFRGQAFFASDLYALGATLLFLLTHRSPDELPHNRMKIDFRDRIAVSSHFAHWLEKMLEPAIEDRYKSAREALGTLHHPKPISQPVRLASLRPPPLGSRVILQRGDRRLRVQLLPLRSPWRDRGRLPIYLIVASHVVLFCFAIVFPAVRILLGLLLILELGILLFRNLKEPHTIEFNAQTCHLFYQGLWWKQEVKQPISTIRGAFLWVNIDFHGVKTVRCELDAYEDRYEFGQSLTPVEKRWLVDEISNFLESLR